LVTTVKKPNNKDVSKIDTSNSSLVQTPARAPYTHDIIRVENLKIAIDLKGADLNVIRGVSFRIPAGKTVALVGESGSGKSILSHGFDGRTDSPAAGGCGNMLE